MTNYNEITNEQESGLRAMFENWIDWFFDEICLSLDAPVYIDANEKMFTIRDYVREVKEHFGFQDVCKRMLSLAYVAGGRVSVLKVLTETAPLVIGDIVLGDNSYT